MSLVQIMVAPNGAYKTSQDHPQLPVTLDAIIDTAKQCYEAGAQALHAHVRDQQQRHCLDFGLYQELTHGLQELVPAMEVQLTTEAGGIYDAAYQRGFIERLQTGYISLSYAEMQHDTAQQDVNAFYRDLLAAPMRVQHIFYNAQQLADFVANIVPLGIDWHSHYGLFVLGRYASGQRSQRQDLDPFLETLQALQCPIEWAVCAFGDNQINCLMAAHEEGGKMRVGFENSLADGKGGIASDNAAQVALLDKLFG